MKGKIFLPVSIIYFILLGSFFAVGFDSSIRGAGDASVAVSMFNHSALSFLNISLNQELQSRFFLLGISLVEVLLLVAFRLVRVNTATVYFIWPFSAFLATKIKFEFFVFPLALIRTDYPLRIEAFIILCLIVLMILLGEGNLAVIILFRLVLVFFRLNKARRKRVLFFTLIGLAFLLDYMFIQLSSYIPFIAKYEWTRDFVNPDYSIVETIAVFFATFFIGIHPQSDFLIGWALALAMMFYIYHFYKKELFLLLNDRRFYAFVAVVVLLCSLTHAFQSARYYYFYLPLIAVYFFKTSRDYMFFILLGVVGSLTMLMYHNGGRWI